MQRELLVNNALPLVVLHNNWAIMIEQRIGTSKERKIADWSTAVLVSNHHEKFGILRILCLIPENLWKKQVFYFVQSISVLFCLEEITCIRVTASLSWKALSIIMYISRIPRCRHIRIQFWSLSWKALSIIMYIEFQRVGTSTSKFNGGFMPSFFWHLRKSFLTIGLTLIDITNFAIWYCASLIAPERDRHSVTHKFSLCAKPIVRRITDNIFCQRIGFHDFLKFLGDVFAGVSVLEKSTSNELCLQVLYIIQIEDCESNEADTFNWSPHISDISN